METDAWMTEASDRTVGDHPRPRPASPARITTFHYAASFISRPVTGQYSTRQPRSLPSLWLGTGDRFPVYFSLVPCNME